MVDYCPNCGQQVRPGARFCSGCGQNLKSSEKQPDPRELQPSVSPPPAYQAPVDYQNSPYPYQYQQPWPDYSSQAQAPVSSWDSYNQAPINVISGVAPVGASMACFAGFGQRAGAYLLDTLVIFLVAGGIWTLGSVLAVILVSSGDDAATLIGLLLSLLALAAQLAFIVWYAVIMPSRTGQTLGKRAMNIRVVDRQGNVPSKGKMAVRYFIGYFLSAMILYIGFLFPLWDENKQALHDKLVDTYVVEV